LGLVDGDPSGLEILSTYVYGSKGMRHESDRLVAGERIEWLGLYLSELTRYEMDLSLSLRRLFSSRLVFSLGVDKDMLLPITKYDEKKVGHFISPFLSFLCQPAGMRSYIGYGDAETIRPSPSLKMEVNN
jgi:hypothetical protein